MTHSKAIEKVWKITSKLKIKLGGMLAWSWRKMEQLPYGFWTFAWQRVSCVCVCVCSVDRSKNRQEFASAIYFWSLCRFPRPFVNGCANNIEVWLLKLYYTANIPSSSKSNNAVLSLSL